MSNKVVFRLVFRFLFLPCSYSSLSTLVHPSRPHNTFLESCLGLVFRFHPLFLPLPHSYSSLTTFLKVTSQGCATPSWSQACLFLSSSYSSVSLSNGASLKAMQLVRLRVSRRGHLTVTSKVQVEPRWTSTTNNFLVLGFKYTKGNGRLVMRDL